MISDTEKGDVELSEHLVVAELFVVAELDFFFEHPPTRSRVAVSRMNAVRQKLSFIFITYINYYFLSISVCLIRPIGLTTTFVLYASFSSVIVPPAAKPKALNEGQRVALIKMFAGTFSL